MSDQQTPQDALEAVRRSREEVRRRMAHSPWWYDLGFGGAVAVMVGGQGAPLPFGPISTAIGLAIIAVIVRKWTDLTGVWINGYQPRRARWVAFALAGLTGAMMLGALAAGRHGGLVWVPAVLGVAAGVMAVIASRLWTRVYLAETKELP